MPFGFEDTFLLPDGQPAASNADLVRQNVNSSLRRLLFPGQRDRR
jgi:uncharacterized protein (DUF849 family)